MDLQLRAEDHLRFARERARKHSATYYAKHKDKVKLRLTAYNERRKVSQKENIRVLREGLEALSIQIISLHQIIDALDRPRLSGLT